jgi:hypothetical protein
MCDVGAEQSFAATSSGAARMAQLGAAAHPNPALAAQAPTFRRGSLQHAKGSGRW